MMSRKCPHCGAPAAVATSGSSDRCSFCGAETYEPGSLHTALTTRAGLMSWSTPVILIAIAVGLMAAARGLWDSSSSTPAPAVAAVATADKPKLTLAGLATTPLNRWQQLDAPGMIGRYESFDVVANLEWARSIAAAWKPDASLYRVEVSRVAKDGTANLVATPDASAQYRFTSPKCIADYKNSTALVDPKSQCDLFLNIKSRDNAVLLEVTTSSSSVEHALEDPVCTLAKAFAALEAADKLPPRPVYDVDMHTWSVDVQGKLHPAWIFSTVIPGQAHIPTVDPTSCVVGR